MSLYCLLHSSIMVVVVVVVAAAVSVVNVRTAPDAPSVRNTWSTCETSPSRRCRNSHTCRRTSADPRLSVYAPRLFRSARYSRARALASAGNAAATLGSSRRKGAATRAMTWRTKVSGTCPSAWGLPTLVKMTGFPAACRSCAARYTLPRT